MNALAVAFGGAAGSLIRYGFILFTVRTIGAMPFYATLGINLVGCFVMGLFSQLILLRMDFPESFKLLMTTGLLGGFTTFSSFCFDVGRLIDNGQTSTAIFYIVTSVGGGIVLFFIGLHFAKALI